jgi:polygalacturonase
VQVHSLYGINNDGLDIDSCDRVVVRGCRIDSQDDAICLKSSTHAPCQNVLVTDCITTTHANHFKIGTETHGGFNNVHACNLIMLTSELKEVKHVGGGDPRGAAGIALGSVDGAYIRNVVVENVFMDGVRIPFFLRHGDLGRTYPGLEATAPQQFDGVTIRNVRAKNASDQGCYFIGLPEMPIKNVVLENSEFSFENCPDESRLNIQVPDNRKIHTSMEAFGKFPCYGVYARYIDGLTLRNVKFHSQGPDPRPAVQYQKCRKVVLDNVIDE